MALCGWEPVVIRWNIPSILISRSFFSSSEGVIISSFCLFRSHLHHVELHQKLGRKCSGKSSFPYKMPHLHHRQLAER